MVFVLTIFSLLIPTLYFCFQVVMENEGQLNNNSNEQDHDGFTIEIPDLQWNNHMEYDVDALLGAEDHVNTTNQTTDDEGHRSPVGETPSKRTKRFTMDQIQELEA